MSYQRRRQRRALGNVQSQPPGGLVHRHALEGTNMGAILGATARRVLGRKGGGLAAGARRSLGDITEYTIMGGTVVHPTTSVRSPRWYRAMQGTSLSGADDAPDPSLLTSPMFSDPFQADVSSRLEDLQRLEAERNRQDQIRGIFQIAATLSIPLAAAVWKWIFKRRNANGAT